MFYGMFYVSGMSAVSSRRFACPTEDRADDTQLDVSLARRDDRDSRELAQDRGSCDDSRQCEPKVAVSCFATNSAEILKY
jgi:hypothetical protein